MATYDTDISAHRYPGIARAALEMSYCNGGINIHRREADVIADLETALTGGVDIAFDLRAISDWLKALDDETLQSAVDGCETEIAEVLKDAPGGTHSLLDAIFEAAA